MKTLATFLIGTALAVIGSAASAKVSGEEQLARLLEGRVVAGEPSRCISAIRGRDVRVIDRVGIVYDAGETVWVARATNPESLRDRDILVVDRFSATSLCRDDIKRTVDRTDGFLKSVVFVEDFVPYRRG